MSVFDANSVGCGAYCFLTKVWGWTFRVCLLLQVRELLLTLDHAGGYWHTGTNRSQSECVVYFTDEVCVPFRTDEQVSCWWIADSGNPDSLVVSLTTMSTLIENIEERAGPARKSGRPRGVVSSQTQRMIATWDAKKRDCPTLNNVALLNAVADAVFGQRVNVHVRRRDRIRLKRTLQRHGRLT